MGNKKAFIAASVLAAFMTTGGPAVADGDVERGKKAFRQCAACHSVEKGDHRTGPSLAKIWGQKAGTIKEFRRYSKALKNADIVWNENTLERWLMDPQTLIPGNRMVFQGVANGAIRQDLIAFLNSLSEGGQNTADGMQGGMMGQGPINLRDLGPNNQVNKVTHCADTYDVTMKNGETHQFWELNLRLKTDSSKNGPPKGVPVLIPGGMRGDRANLVFASPQEISGFIKQRC